MDVVFKIKEFNVPVPWGHIAVKAWGDEKNMPILVVHGRMDNAGAFDRLIPLLPNSYYYICIDLPGHGRSSHFPPHLPLYTINYLLVYKLIMQYFKRNTYFIMGHSYGGQIGFLFTQLYSHYVEKLILLDAPYCFALTSVSDFKDYLIEKMDNNLSLQEKLCTGKQPTYTYEEAFKKLLSGRENTPLTPDAAEGLLQRAIEPAGDGRYKFTLDQRMKYYIDPLHDIQFILETIKTSPIICPILAVVAKDSFVIRHEIFKKMTSVLKKQGNISVKYIQGGHDVHSNNPEIIAPYINDFLLNKEVLAPLEQKGIKKLLFKSVRLLKWIR